MRTMSKISQKVNIKDNFGILPNEEFGILPKWRKFTAKTNALGRKKNLHESL